ncbi:TetR/AcrR family transcriptional regulator [Verticiella sediminum]|uniref:TetR/AcrR family transcriptional regulator n=1 Tax=Verticiella sediminum TaxID=1247510 RepID=A0A556AY63_9BURK|nr:TetR/AcrR family transcriptional regulator [Verticiella sediminum]TSH97862.1 TetR/AcrR family transcriptional regulator [Verticiella sediminum]
MSMRATAQAGGAAERRSTVRAATGNNRELQRRTVLEAAARLFMERGFAGTSMSDVARTLQVSRPTLYYYFENKDSILAALVEEVTITSSENSRALDQDADPIQALHGAVRRQVEFIIENATIYRVLTNSQVFLPPSLRAVNDEAKQAIFKNFEHLIERGVASGRLREVNPALAALTVIGMCNWTASWYREGGGLARPQVAEQIADMATAALAAPTDARQVHEALNDAQHSLARLAALLGPA